MQTLNAILGGCCFVFGIALMGSETGMPWCQVVGAIIFSGILFFARLAGE